MDDKFFPAKSAISQISRWKDKLISPEEALQTAARDTTGGPLPTAFTTPIEKTLKAGRCLRF